MCLWARSRAHGLLEPKLSISLDLIGLDSMLVALGVFELTA